MDNPKTVSREDADGYKYSQVDEISEMVKELDQGVHTLMYGAILSSIKQKMEYQSVLSGLCVTYVNIAALGMIFAMYMLTQAQEKGGSVWVLFGASVGFAISCAIRAYQYHKDCVEIQSVLEFEMSLMEKED